MIDFIIGFITGFICCKALFVLPYKNEHNLETPSGTTYQGLKEENIQPGISYRNNEIRIDGFPNIEPKEEKPIKERKEGILGLKGLCGFRVDKVLMPKKAKEHSL